MADFIAVIRRAVDGLSENTPEMRVKVYERARGAVQRQLESMKPRPPEAMLQRQLDKLEAAIREVEAEHAEAVLADDAALAAEPAVGASADAVHEQEAGAPEPLASEAGVEVPAHETPAHEDHVAAEESAPAYEEPAPYHEEPAPSYEEPVAAEPEHIAQQEEHWAYEEPPAPVGEAEPVEHGHAAPSEEVVHEDQHGHEEHVSAPEEPLVEPTEPTYKEPALQPIARDYDMTNRLVEPVLGLDRPPEEFVDRSQEEPLHADAAGHFDPVWAEPVEETPAPPAKDAQTDWALEELRQFSEAAPVAPANEAARAFEDVIAGIDHTPGGVKMPAANEGFSWEAAAFDDLPPIENGKKVQVNAHFDDGDLFSEIHGTPAAKSASETNPAWQEAKPLRGYDNRGVVAEDDDGAADLDSAVAAKFQGKNFRMEPKRRRFGIGSIVTILVALGVVGGGGYAAWTNQDALSSMVKNLVSAAPSQSAKNEQTPAKPDAATPQTSDAKPTDAKKEVASLNDGASVNNKFNQRLLADGTEVDSGPATVPGTPTAEGKSVAEQNVAAADTTPPAASTPATGAPAVTAPAAPPPAAGATQAAPLGSTEKMFLYEERIGQSSPTAIQGSVVWSLQHEAGSDGRQEATVQATVTVPERNLSAQLTFKRNSDPSLPASHIVEVVFSLPPNFEGGAIESVQRISMKRTEQDRGDALIAVPAKITDDFHMIALNDYPDARKANLDLLSSRDWIDIPITYRNGRRALLTMQKGSTGGEAFNAAIKEWAAFGDVSTSQ
ncbi:hypothetical protein PMI09_05274 [Rhizobium sp. CF122]|uniref:hypothetical protein n=1 Tax=Rhizobium sp. CF122 TaxID=1144312 RepID=UPI0002715CCC|nr:hypothetical protein [Rhizobium sp. CF122]EJL50094.1 hypothetical protein PMI09_05274 [Rhizobium sp. CF122]